MQTILNFVFLVNLIKFLAGVELDERVDAKQCVIWGPGLNSNFTLPVRYFFIQLVNTENKNITKSFGDDFLKVSIYQAKINFIQVHTQVLNRRDGSYLVRYRLYESYSHLIISVRDKYDNQIGNSPFYLNHPVYDEFCDCPENDVNKWYESMSCNLTYTQIEIDLAKFEPKSVDMNEVGKTIINKYNQRFSQSLCNYVILNNEVYRRCFGEHVGFHIFADSILLSLSRKVKLPDSEFFMNLGDWPLSEKEALLPIVSWCGSSAANDLVLPTYDLTESVVEMMGRQSLDLFTVEENAESDWAAKLNRSFWRGRDSRRERLDLVLMSRESPGLIDAALTNMFFYREPQEIQLYGPVHDRVPFFDFFKFKYQLSLDGTVAAYRFPYLLAGKSTVFKQDSVYYENFYVDLKPFVHYVPFKHDLSDLVEKLKWAKENDDLVILQKKTFRQNAHGYARDYLTPNHIYCYHVKFFQRYSKILSSRIRLRDGMEKVNANKQSKCDCDLKKNIEL